MDFRRLVQGTAVPEFLKVRFLRKVLPQAAKMPGTSGSFKNKVDFLEKALPQAAKLPRTSGFFKNEIDFLEKKFCPWQRSCPGQVVSSKKVDFLEKVLPQAEELPRTSGFFKKKTFSGKESAPGSEAARDKWLLLQKSLILRRSSAQAAKLPGTSGVFNFFS